MENNRKSRTLNKQADFNNLRKFGKRYSPKPWMTVNYSQNTSGYLRFGFTISGKVGTAVTRNKLKRWLKEFIRQEIKNGFDPSLDLNIFLKPVGNDFYAKLHFSEVQKAIQLLAGRLK